VKKTGAAAIAGLLFVFTCSGCLEFEREIMVVVHPAKNADARMLLVYEGIHARSGGNPKDDKLIVKACFQDKQGFYYGNPLFACFLSGPLAERGPAMSEREKQFYDLIKTHVSISDAGVFLNEDGKLCGWQILTLRKTEQLVRGLNDFIASCFAEFAAEGLADPKKCGKEWNRQSLQLIRTSIQQRHAWLTLEPGRISFALPGNQSLFAGLKRNVLSGWETAGAVGEKIESARRQCAFLSETPLSVDQRRDRLIISVGVGGGQPIRVNCDYGPREAQKLDDQLIQYAKSLDGNLGKRKIEPFIADFLLLHRASPIN
jgi:hypothetical protein